MSQHNIPTTLEQNIRCPFKPVLSNKCHHKFAERKGNRLSQTPVCRYPKNPELCPLFNAWKRDKEAIERINHTISKEVSSI